jgi:hypothetical protein
MRPVFVSGGKLAIAAELERHPPQFLGWAVGGFLARDDPFRDPGEEDAVPATLDVRGVPDDIIRRVGALAQHIRELRNSALREIANEPRAA